MKVVIAPLVVSLSLLVFPSLGQVPGPEKTEIPQKNDPSKPSGAALLVARIHDGELTGGVAEEAQNKIRTLFPNLAITFLTAAEATESLAGDRPLLQAAKGFKDEHFVFMLKDSRGTIFHRSIAQSTLEEGVAKVLNEALGKQASVVQLLNAADAAKGEDRLRQLAAAAETLGAESFRSLYPEFTKELLNAPTEERKPLLTKLHAPSKEQERTDAINRLHFDLSMNLRTLPPTATLEDRIARIDGFIAERKLEGELKQIIVMRKYLTYSSAGKFDDAMKALDEAINVLPTSALAGRIPGFKQALQARKDKAAAEKNAPQPPLAPPAPNTPPPPAETPPPAAAPVPPK